MTEALDARAEANRQSGVHFTITDLILAAVSQTLPRFPRLNAWVEPNCLVLHSSVNLGIVVAVNSAGAPGAISTVSGVDATDAGGLIVPVLPMAETRGLRELSVLARELTSAARRGITNAANLATFTVTTLGNHGVRQFLPIIHPPEAAILGVGSVERRAVATATGVRARQMMTLTLACDHRAVDGVYAAGCLNTLKERLENPKTAIFVEQPAVVSD